MKTIKRFFVLAFFFVSLQTSFANMVLENGRDALVGVFWYDGTLFFPQDRYLMSEGGYGTVSSEQFQAMNPKDKEMIEAAANLLEEARYVFSGVLYGWRFHYQPSDKLRNVKEVFRLEPIAQIPVGDPNLEPLSSDQKGISLLRLQVRYHLTSKDMNHLAFRSSPSLLFSTGMGSGSIQENFAGRKEAIEQSVKEAIRNHQRKRLHAKPQILSGVAYLEQPPRVFLKSGKFWADSRVLFQLKTVKQYFLP